MSCKRKARQTDLLCEVAFNRSALGFATETLSTHVMRRRASHLATHSHVWAVCFLRRSARHLKICASLTTCYRLTMLLCSPLRRCSAAIQENKTKQCYYFIISSWPVSSQFHFHCTFLLNANTFSRSLFSTTSLILPIFLSSSFLTFCFYFIDKILS